MFALVVTATSMAQSFTYVYKGVEFKGKIDNNEACIKSFDKKAPNVTIPASITHKGASFPVKSVGVFMNGVNYSTVYLTLEEGIEDIDKFCFNEFRKLRSVSLPASLRHIGKNAFRDNDNMSFNMLSSIDEYALRDGRELYPDGSGEFLAHSSPDEIKQQQQAEKEQQEATEKEMKAMMAEMEKLEKEKQKLLAEKERAEKKNTEKAQKAEESGNNGSIFDGMEKGVNSIAKGVTGLFSFKSKEKKSKKKSESQQQQPVVAQQHHQQQSVVQQPQQQQYVAATNAKPTAPALPPVDVDMDIPVVKTDKNANTYCIIIANEKYEDVPEVEYAERDGKIFAEYCVKTLGIPERQVKSFINASYTDIKRALNWVETMADISNGNSKVIFYYAGHGIPNEKDKTAYLIPTDGFPKDITTCFKLSDLYTRLGKMKTQNVTVLLDACFSGVKRGTGQALVAARGVAIKPKNDILTGNMVVFTAASDDETALSYKDKRHGMFTYFLLDKLKKSRGNASFGEIFNTLSTEVKKNSMLENDKLQTPSVNVSSSMKLKWEKMQF